MAGAPLDRRDGPDPAAGAPAAGALDRLIPAEIRRDRFARAIEAVGATPGVAQILEIGASAGEGSTEAWVRGALRNPRRPQLHCIEVSVARFAALVERWRMHDFVHCYNVSSVPAEAFASEAEVARFHREVRSKLRNVRLEKVLGWLRQDLAYLGEHGLSADGIARIRAAHGIARFDAVLIDGSEFTGKPELEAVYGARFLLLDDIRSFKNWENYRRLRRDPSYRLVRRSRWLRNGFAVFERTAG
jgi:hypothetical protein